MSLRNNYSNASGLIGGGWDSIIGNTHLPALRADGLAEVVAGAFSINPEVAVASARALLLDPDRSYPTWQVMLEAENVRPDRVDAVVIITAPQFHGEISAAFLAAGFHVLCEKPMMGSCGSPRTSPIGIGGSGAARWVRPAFGEVGSHAHNIVECVSGQRVTEVIAQLTTIAARREIFDNAYLTVQFDGGAVGRLWSSFVAAGNEHGLEFRIFGDDGSLQWRQEDAEFLWLLRPGRAATRISRGIDETSDASRPATPSGPGIPRDT